MWRANCTGARAPKTHPCRSFQTGPDVRAHIVSLLQIHPARISLGWQLKGLLTDSLSTGYWGISWQSPCRPSTHTHTQPPSIYNYKQETFNEISLRGRGWAKSKADISSPTFHNHLLRKVLRCFFCSHSMERETEAGNGYITESKLHS